MGTARTIPGFGGKIFAPDMPGYDEKRTQYATSSYKEKQGRNGTMHPYLIAYPRMGTDDIPTAIRFAKDAGKHIVARSGGHQYCGLSSGGEDTILLSMDLYKYMDVHDAGDATFARVGVGTLLTDLAAELKRNRITIPHGECPLVAIGGHAQSGGYGHLKRSFGLALDHVAEFKIVTADGVLRTVTRPPAEDRSSLFWGVLGGGPGSFGVITEVTFQCLRDRDHPYSSGQSRVHVYEKSLFHAAMNEAQVWTERIAAGDPTFPPDVDLSMSLTADRFFGRPVFIVEMVNGNRDGRDDHGKNRRFLEQTRANILRGASWWNRAIPRLGFEGSHSLSFMADGFVRRVGFTADGREYPLPVKKRVNATKSPLRDDFIEAFVDLVDRAARSKTLNLVVQLFVGGGAYASPDPMPPLTSICHRDMLFGIVFDCFYKPEGLRDAERFQAEMQDLLHMFSGDQEVRMLWGSFGDTRMSNESVRRCYYDDETWRDLQRLKRDVDPGDLFHTEFTVQLGTQPELAHPKRPPPPSHH